MARERLAFTTTSRRLSSPRRHQSSIAAPRCTGLRSSRTKSPCCCHIAGLGWRGAASHSCRALLPASAETYAAPESESASGTVPALMTSPRIRHEGTPTSPRHSADLSQSSTSPQSIGARSRTAAAANCATPRANPSRAPPTTQPSPSTAARRASVRRARSSRSEPSHEH